MKKQQTKALALGRRVVSGFYDASEKRWPFAILPTRSGDGDPIPCDTLAEVDRHLKVLEKRVA